MAQENIFAGYERDHGFLHLSFAGNESNDGVKNIPTG